MTQYAVVVGAGVLGLACGAELARRGREVLILEASGRPGGGVSSRNSEVVHGGMYYPAGSARARHCVHGRRRLYAYCDQRKVDYRKYGKLIVATDAEEAAKIEAIHASGLRNEVEDLRLLSAAEVTALEPALRSVGAVLSPETGVVDSEGLMTALRGEIEDAGGAVVVHTPVEAIAPLEGGGFHVRTGGREPFKVEAGAVVNAAGLAAQAVARTVEGFPSEHVPRQVLAKGNYFKYRGRPVFSRLIYPAPVEGGLGVHVTLDLAGQMRFGPDVEWIDAEHYDVDPARAEAFYAAIRRYWPGLPDDSLAPDYAGIRPKLTGPGEAAADFLIQGPGRHGLPGLVNLFGIESPGLTSSLSIAEEVADLLAD